MPNLTRDNFLMELSKRFGVINKLENSQSLYEIGDGAARIYIRYSKIYKNAETFYGLRLGDLKQLEGYSAAICFLWDNQVEPLIVPYSDYEEIFLTTQPAQDNQFKSHVRLAKEGISLHISRAGTFNVELYLGWGSLEKIINYSQLSDIPSLSHSQIQTLLGAIGIKKGFDIWIPNSDRVFLDWNVSEQYQCRESLPYQFEKIIKIIQEVDVIWLRRGSSELKALFEVEHSTPIYSGLLRFNDVHLIAPNLDSTYSIVGEKTRRNLFVKQINRPTFQTSGLSDICSFMEYPNVYSWYQRLK